MKNTLIVNLLAGPGARKSTMAASIFAELKWLGIDSEIAPEYAKELVWEKRPETLKNQIYVFGKQHHRIFRLVGQVDVIITDSPLFLTPIYAPKLKTLTKLTLEEISKLNSINIFITRKKNRYNPNGRNQTEEEAIEIDVKIKSFLNHNKIDYIELPGLKKSILPIVKLIKETIKQQSNILIDIDKPIVKSDKCQTK